MNYIKAISAAIVLTTATSWATPGTVNLQIILSPQEVLTRAIGAQPFDMILGPVNTTMKAIADPANHLIPDNTAIIRTDQYIDLVIRTMIKKGLLTWTGPRAPDGVGQGLGY
ncbi:MAG: hypothetical protein NTX76_05220 [Alphaproteobacteria bacterium]|nr:hypothetical protein [Alphaproteobacteria bacterium]